MIYPTWEAHSLFFDLDDISHLTRIVNNWYPVNIECSLDYIDPVDIVCHMDNGYLVNYDDFGNADCCLSIECHKTCLYYNCLYDLDIYTGFHGIFVNYSHCMIAENHNDFPEVSVVYNGRHLFAAVDDWVCVLDNWVSLIYTEGTGYIPAQTCPWSLGSA